MTFLDAAVDTVRGFESRAIVGTVDAVRGLTVLVRRFRVPIGSVVRIGGDDPRRDGVLGEVVGFEAEREFSYLFCIEFAKNLPLNIFVEILKNFALGVFVDELPKNAAGFRR